MSTDSYKASGEYEGEYDDLCEAAYYEGDTEHDCGLDKDHKEAHKCFCGYEF